MLQTLIETLAPSRPPTTKLQAALADLDIEMLDSARVADYKKTLLDETWKKMLLTLPSWKESPSDTHNRDYVAEARHHLGKRWTDADRFIYMRSYEQGQPTCFAMGWHRYEASEVASSIPGFVTRKIDQIKGEVPGVTFEVDRLESNQTGYDPFLVVKKGKEEYYVEVWGDEDHKFPR